MVLGAMKLDPGAVTVGWDGVGESPWGSRSVNCNVDPEAMGVGFAYWSNFCCHLVVS